MYSIEKMLSVAPIETEIVFCKPAGEQKTIVVESGEQMLIHIFCSCSPAFKKLFFGNRP
jgi:hypothetical protein